MTLTNAANSLTAAAKTNNNGEWVRAGLQAGNPWNIRVKKGELEGGMNGCPRHLQQRARAAPDRRLAGDRPGDERLAWRLRRRSRPRSRRRPPKSRRRSRRAISTSRSPSTGSGRRSAWVRHLLRADRRSPDEERTFTGGREGLSGSHQDRRSELRGVQRVDEHLQRSAEVRRSRQDVREVQLPSRRPVVAAETPNRSSTRAPSPSTRTKSRRRSRSCRRPSL